jgi:hypothetical protein
VTELAFASGAALGPHGAYVVFGRWPSGITFVAASGARYSCAGEAVAVEHLQRDYPVRFRPDGERVLVLTEEAWIDVSEGCTAAEGDAGWAGMRTVTLDQGKVFLEGRVVGEGELLAQVEGGVGVFVGRDLVATVGEGGWVPRGASAHLEERRWGVDRRGGWCVNLRRDGGSSREGHGAETKRLEGPKEASTRCWRFRDGRVFDHAGLAVDVDLSLDDHRFVDLDSGEEVGFPEWGGGSLTFEDDPGGCNEVIYPSGAERSRGCY